MWRKRYLAVLIVVLTVVISSTAEVFDVTTVCRYGVESPAEDDYISATKYNKKVAVEIHGRNNALGLPLLLHNKTVVEPNIGVDFDKCSIYSGKCEWKKNQFEETHTGLPGSQLVVTGERQSHYTNKMIKNIRFSKDFNFAFETSAQNGKFGIFLTDKKADVTSSDMYFIYLTPTGSGSSSHLLKCSTQGDTRYNLPYSMGSRYCTSLQAKSLGVSTWGSQRYYSRYTQQNSYYEARSFTFRVQYYGSRIKVSAEVSGSEYNLFDFQDASPINVKYISLGTDGGLEVSLQVDVFPVWALKGMDGSLESPPFVPTSNKVCVSVTYYEETNSSLDLSTLRPSGNKLNFMPISMNSLSEGWKTSNYLAQLPDDAMREIVTIHLTAHTSDDFLVQRISGCNGEELENTVVLDDTMQIPDYGYDVAVTRKSPSDEVSLTCINGGKFDKERQGCVCPAGFIGDTCDIGCGKNTYGSKCDARCSLTARGCRGMRLCRPALPCSCAPGLKGEYCDTPCEPGTYGANCEQKCGSCSNRGQHIQPWSKCDVFTGLCTRGCESGYFPPHCKETYKYMTVAPDVSADFVYMVVAVSLNSDSQKGLGSPNFYQIQYRRTSLPQLFSWIELEPRPITALKSVMNITGLESATHYQVRVILIDSDFDSYQGSEVATKEVRTKCEVSAAVRYDLHVIEATGDSLHVAWNYTSERPFSCPVTHFEVQRKELWRWLSHSTQKKMSVKFMGLLPGQTYEVRVRAVTIDGPSQFSNVLVTNTKDEAPWKVFQLEFVSKTSSELKVKWTPPLITAGKIRGYRVTYECRKLLGCSKEDCSHSGGQVEVKSNSVDLRDLLPHAQYSVSVAAQAGLWGPDTEIRAVTEMAAPAVAPDSSSNSTVVQNTNTSFIVQWKPPHNCSRLNGYLYGYRYQLLRQDESKVIKEGNTAATTAAFTDLEPHTKYIVKVFLETSEGWNAAQPLSIPMQTRATTPDMVEGLTVYKRGRRMLGVRWAAPNMTYGDIESFTISYQKESDLSPTSKVLMPSPCVAWPSLFCHTINHLIPDAKYTVLVRARNVEVPEDGVSASVHAITKEGSPEAPPYVRIKSQSQTDLFLEWGLPTMLNGVLRSFLVNVEETDSFNATDCCQYFPIQEVPVGAEQGSYSIQITDLKPASTYTVSVTAKTVTLSPAAMKTAHTRPHVPPMDNLIEMSEDPTVLLTTYEPGETPRPPISVENLGDISENIHRLSTTPEFVIRPSQVYQNLISGYLIVVLPQESLVQFNATIWDSWLFQEIETLTNGTFYIAAEFKHIDLDTSTSFVVGAGSDAKVGKWGVVQNPELEKGSNYRIGLVAILEYCGVLNVGYTESDIFQAGT